jgi:signal transduction histidine kinase
MKGNKNAEQDFKLRIDAHALIQLGDQLITDDEQALLELVKNSYDADAEWVKVRIISDYRPTKNDGVEKSAIGLIEIEDNGVGMDKSGIERGWLMISLSGKRDLKARGERTKRFHRLPLGDKGLGRLGTMKLGKFLSLETRSNPKQEGWRITFQWSDVRSGTPLEDVPITVERVPATGSTGTTVRIYGLRDPDGWRSKKRERRLEVRLSGLLSPFEPIANFQIELNLDEYPLILTRINKQLRDAAAVTVDYKWQGHVLSVNGRIKLSWFRKKKEEYDAFIGADSGAAFLQELFQSSISKRFNLSKSTHPAWFLEFETILPKGDLPFAKQHAEDPGEFFGSLDYFDLDADVAFPKEVFNNAKDYRDVVKELARLYVYRNGFGIRMPNDWLRLGAAWTSQTGFYSLKPNNVIGYFNLTVEGNPELVEKSDREGFTENDAWRGFALLTDAVVNAINRPMNALGKAASKYLKEKAGISATSENANAKYDHLLGRLEELLRDFSLLSERVKENSDTRKITLRTLEGAVRMFTLDLGQSKESRERAKRLLEGVQRVHNDLEKDYADIESVSKGIAEQRELPAIIRGRIDDFEERSVVLYEMAGIGLSAQALAHDVEPLLRHLEDQSRALVTVAKSRPIDVSKVQEQSLAMKASAETVRQMLDFVQPSLRGRRLTRRNGKLSEFVKGFYELRGARLYGRGITWKMETETMDDFRISYNEGRLYQLLDNLTTNSEYWIEQKYGVGTRKGQITVEIHDPEFIFYDNGPGVRPDLEESLFELFSSGREGNDGNGLGLFITRELLKRDNCSIYLAKRRNSEGRRFQFHINFSGVKADAK